MKKSLRVILLSFSMTIIILGGIWMLGLTHYRMQNTINSSDYTLIELYKTDENQLQVLFDNQTYIVDFSNIVEKIKDLSSLEIFVPASLKIIYSTVDLMIDDFTEYLSSIIIE